MAAPSRLRGPVSEPTLASAVVDRLRGDILDGVLPPGEKLRLEHLAPRYGVGRTPLREACCRLASEGLVTIVDQRGFRVAPISRADLLDLTRTRQQIEPLALRAAITLGDIAWEGEVTAALHRLQRRAPASGSGTLDDTWELEHARFHATLLSACGSPWLLKFHATLFDQTERYRRLAQAHGKARRSVEDEHAALVKATLARNAERACALLTEHIARTTELVLAGHPGLRAAGAAPALALPTKGRSLRAKD
ncbi:FCD domain-containing protein [Myxococcus sp. AM009]|uniref:GntR family transcriptional regulator n=1 Tax=unclassified Myxococcus TaxID=2648731 RepID=UPI001595FEF8|nr:MULTISPECIES: FCD domain-containing protein [unclassified Myxococcus]NVI96910.1 FCD domain-containing protein [Myxococcus sp. AM009]NVJ13979.1 FCD domain-containing protein [Myxococcus sp. AM010]